MIMPFSETLPAVEMQCVQYFTGSAIPISFATSLMHLSKNRMSSLSTAPMLPMRNVSASVTFPG